jgi:hypothetical protein
LEDIFETRSRQEKKLGLKSGLFMAKKSACFAFHWQLATGNWQLVW